MRPVCRRRGRCPRPFAAAETRADAALAIVVAAVAVAVVVNVTQKKMKKKMMMMMKKKKKNNKKKNFGVVEVAVESERLVPHLPPSSP